MRMRHLTFFAVGISAFLICDRLDVQGGQPGPVQTLAFEKFVDPLPTPPRIVIGPNDPNELTVTLQQFQAKLHRDLPETTQWGYDGSSPGPTIEVESGKPLRVHWKNQLPTTHLLAAPKNMDMGNNWPDVRTVTHLHGAVVTEADPMDRQHNNDGWPDAWITPGQETLAEYPNPQDARILWYHDHAMGETGRNVATGLVGMYLIHDNYERSLNLPSGDYDLPLIFQAKGLNPNGTLYYTSDIQNEFYGNVVAVNGKVWPYLSVEPRKYRFRMVNTSNARSLAFKVVDFNNPNNAGPAIYQIGSDSGFLENTAILNDPTDSHSPRLTLAPSERADVIVDFSKFAGKTLLLQNNSITDPDSELALPQILMFKVGAQVSSSDTSSLPMKMRPIPRLDPEQVAATRQIVLQQNNPSNGPQVMQLNGKLWNDPIEEKPVLGSTEIWELVNTTIIMHPFHMHLVQFQVLDRTPFDANAYASTGKINFTGPAVMPDANEMGWKDVVRTPAFMVTRIIVKFGPYPGYYVYHCHILEHEDMDMMRPFEIVNEAK
jgi:spore coat protein A